MWYMMTINDNHLYVCMNCMFQDLPQEYNRFARVDKSYMKMMKRAYETKNVLQVTWANHLVL